MILSYMEFHNIEYFGFQIIYVGPSFRIVMRTVNLPSRRMATLSDNHCWAKETDINEAI